MQPDNQIYVPPSFIALFSDARGRLTVPAAEVADRYELCEDLANHLVEQAQGLHHGAAVPSEEEILDRMLAALITPESGFTLPEGHWVATRLAELLNWPAPRLPEAPIGS
ncbi:hypothetical protein FVQ98_16220 [Ottowia sp. GY511]|uniref:ATPase with chaperone activity n=1 Tax=Ottowia flava TaxID=2675430 RepID=A0ABW4KZU2_9BURK|nr:hypothetical protein [Ottowia sp. GY511]TXK24816.1 hypothetical protein FVQ98_16220 [Ottowia sp. GY511]